MASLKDKVNYLDGQMQGYELSVNNLGVELDQVSSNVERETTATITETRDPKPPIVTLEAAVSKVLWKSI